MATTTNVKSILQKGAPSVEAHELDLDAIFDERLDDPVTDEAILNFAIVGQLQPAIVRPNAKETAFEVVDGRQRVKRALIINDLVGRYQYKGQLASVREACARLRGTDICKRIADECPSGVKVKVTPHRGDAKSSEIASVSANEMRHDDDIDRKVRKAIRLSKSGFDNAEIAQAMGRTELTISRWLGRNSSEKREKKARGATTMPKAKIRKVLEGGTPELSQRETMLLRFSVDGLGTDGFSVEFPKLARALEAK